MSHHTFHVALTVKDLSTAIEQYKKILGIEPAKVKPDYAKFELSNPPVILSLNPGPGEPGTVSHLGIRYADSETMGTELQRTKAHDMSTREQVSTTCCYAKANKFWLTDADGMPWEMYTLLDDAEVHSTPDTTCCVSPAHSQAAQLDGSATGGCAPGPKALVNAPLVQIETKRSCC